MRNDPSRRQIVDVVFEQQEVWLSALLAQVVRLAQQIMQVGASSQLQYGLSRTVASVRAEVPAFPSALVLEELEEIAATLDVCCAEADDESGAPASESKCGVASSRERGWAIRCFCEIGFSYGTLVESLVAILDHWQGKAPEKVLHLLSSTAYALLHWTRHSAE